MVTNLFHRLGMVGAIVIATALIFGAIAGGVVVHRLDTTPSASSEQAQGDQSGQKAGDVSKKAPASKKGANNGANDGHQDSSNSESSQDEDV